jgi:hypothetical protein
MSGREGTLTPRVSLTPLHLVRAGDGLDEVRLQARGFGLLLGSAGLRWVRRSLDAVALRRFAKDRCWALFLGLHGVAWASVRLKPAGRASVPAVEQLKAHPLPVAAPLPSFGVNLTLRPPEPP